MPDQHIATSPEAASAGDSDRRAQDTYARIDESDRREKLALASALWQDGWMHLDGPDTLASLAIEHLRDRGWHNPFMAQASHQAFDKLWRAFLLVAVTVVALFVGLVVLWTTG